MECVQVPTCFPEKMRRRMVKEERQARRVQDAWLIIDTIRTLSLRLEVTSESGLVGKYASNVYSIRI